MLNAKTIAECVELAAAARQNLVQIETKFESMGLCEDDLSDMLSGISYSTLYDDVIVGLRDKLQLMAVRQKEQEDANQLEIDNAIKLLRSKGMIVRDALAEFDILVESGAYPRGVDLLDEVYPDPTIEFVAEVNERIKDFPIDKIFFWVGENGWDWDEAHN